jgi:hypothetical protein
MFLEFRVMSMSLFLASYAFNRVVNSDSVSYLLWPLVPDRWHLNQQLLARRKIGQADIH